MRKIGFTVLILLLFAVSCGSDDPLAQQNDNGTNYTDDSDNGDTFLPDNNETSDNGTVADNETDDTDTGTYNPWDDQDEDGDGVPNGIEGTG